MGVQRKTALAHRSNYGDMRPLSAVRYIALHYTANDGDTDEANGMYFQGAGRHASAHYFVDDDSITMSVPDDYVAWSVGGSKWPDCAQTGGGRLYGTANNTNSISIEMCDTVRDGKVMATEKTMGNAAMLCRELMEKYNIDTDHVIRHFDVNGKHCPAYFMDDTEWEKFKDRLRTVKFGTDRVYAVTRDCYLRKNAGTGGNKVKYSVLSAAVMKKCRSLLGHAVFKKGCTFRLVRVKEYGKDIWGQMHSGYWVPLVYKGKMVVK